MMSRLVALVGGFAVATSGSRISPALNPKSDDTFFGKDYPDDHRVMTPTHFEHPFPHVQDSDNYDKDYIKDENADGGEWAAQMSYDQLRHDIDKQKSDIARAKAGADGAEDDLHKVSDAEAAAQKKADEAEEAEKAAKAAEKDAAKAEDAASAALDAANTSESSANMTLEDCKKQLEDAKSKVKKLTKEAADAKAAADAAKNGEKVAHDAKEATDIDSLNKAHADAAAAAAAAEADAAELKKSLDALRKQAEAAEKEHSGAEKSHAELQADIKKTEGDLEKATASLRKVRMGQVDPGGGIHHGEEPHSAAVKSTGVMALFVAMAVFTTC